MFPDVGRFFRERAVLMASVCHGAERVLHAFVPAENGRGPVWALFVRESLRPPEVHLNLTLRSN
jgi:hypothetical protein